MGQTPNDNSNDIEGAQIVSQDIPLASYIKQVEGARELVRNLDLPDEERELVVNNMLFPAILEGEGSKDVPWEPIAGETIDNMLPTIIGRLVISGAREATFRWSGRLITLALTQEETMVYVRPVNKGSLAVIKQALAGDSIVDMIEARIAKINEGGILPERSVKSPLEYATDLIDRINTVAKEHRAGIVTDKEIWKAFGKLLLAEGLQAQGEKKTDLSHTAVEIAKIISGFESADRGIFALELAITTKKAGIFFNMRDAHDAAYRIQRNPTDRETIEELILKYSPPEAGDQYVLAMDALLARTAPSHSNNIRIE